MIAEDITQEVFLVFWERPLAYDPGRGTLRAWLATIAHRRAVDHVRVEERRRVSMLGPRLYEPNLPGWRTRCSPPTRPNGYARR